MKLIKYYQFSSENSYSQGTCYDGKTAFNYSPSSTSAGRHYPDEFLIAHILNKYLFKRFGDQANNKIFVITEPWKNEANATLNIRHGHNAGDANQNINKYINEAITEKNNKNKLILVPFLYGYHHPGIAIDMSNKKMLYIDPYGGAPKYTPVNNLISELQNWNSKIKERPLPWYMKLYRKFVVGLLKFISFFYTNPKTDLDQRNVTELESEGNPIITHFDFVTTKQQHDVTNCGPILTASMIKFIEEYERSGQISQDGFQEHKKNLATDRLFQMYINNTVILDDGLGVDEVMLADADLFKTFLQEQNIHDADESIINHIVGAINLQKVYVGSLKNKPLSSNNLAMIKFIQDFQSRLTELVFLKKIGVRNTEFLNLITLNTDMINSPDNSKPIIQLEDLLSSERLPSTLRNLQIVTSVTNNRVENYRPPLILSNSQGAQSNCQQDENNPETPQASFDETDRNRVGYSCNIS